MLKCDIILRTCDRIYSVHTSSSETKHRIPGPEFSKLDIMVRCINSLITSINLCSADMRLIVIDDNSSDEGIERITQLIRKCKCPTEFISLENVTGNGASLKACYDWARNNGSDYLFFVEDDYLHCSCCMSEMLGELDFFRTKLRNHEVAIFPYDNIDNYMQTVKNEIPCFMTLGSKRHWRTVTNSTSTFLCSKYILDHYWFLFERMKDYAIDPSVSRDTTTNIIWTAPYKQAGGAYLLSPIPTLSLHFHYREHLSPFVNWKEWWDKNDPESLSDKIKSES